MWSEIWIYGMSILLLFFVFQPFIICFKHLEKLVKPMIFNQTGKTHSEVDTSALTTQTAFLKLRLK